MATATATTTSSLRHHATLFSRISMKMPTELPSILIFFSASHCKMLRECVCFRCCRRCLPPSPSTLTSSVELLSCSLCVLQYTSVFTFHWLLFPFCLIYPHFDCDIVIWHLCRVCACRLYMLWISQELVAWFSIYHSNRGKISFIGESGWPERKDSYI